jgi:hypothetical protein
MRRVESAGDGEEVLAEVAALAVVGAGAAEDELLVEDHVVFGVVQRAAVVDQQLEANLAVVVTTLPSGPYDRSPPVSSSTTVIVPSPFVLFVAHSHTMRATTGTGGSSSGLRS